MASSTASALRASNKKRMVLLQNGSDHDFIIVCSGREFQLHQDIVCSRSPFMKVLCASAIKAKGVVRTFLPDTDTIALEKVFEYMYTGSYEHEYTHKFSKDLTSVPQNGQGSVSPSLDSSATLIDLDSDHEYAPKYSLRLYTGLFAHESQELASMHLNIRIYIIAIFIDDQKLKDEASKRCKDVLYKTMKIAMHDKEFLPVVEEVLRNVDHGDTGLRLDFVDLCSRFVCGKSEWKELAGVFEQHEPVALHVARRLTLPIGATSSSGTATGHNDIHENLECSKKVAKKAIATDNQVQLLRGMLASSQSALEEAQAALKNAHHPADDTLKAKDKELKALRKLFNETTKKLSTTEKALSDQSVELVKLRKGKDCPDESGRAFISKLTYGWDDCRGKGCDASFNGVVLFHGDERKPVLVCKYCGAKHKEALDKK